MLMNVCPDVIFWTADPFCYQTWYGDTLWARLSFKKIGLLSSRSRSQLWIKYVIWTTDPFATKLGLMVHHHKVDCLIFTVLESDVSNMKERNIGYLILHRIAVSEFLIDCRPKVPSVLPSSSLAKARRRRPPYGSRLTAHTQWRMGSWMLPTL